MLTITTLQRKVLEIIGTFGFLTTRAVAQIAWPNHAAHPAQVSAQAVLQRLLMLGLVLDRVVLTDRQVRKKVTAVRGLPKAFVLTRRGALVLNELHAERYCETPLPAGDAPLWFGDGYNLSLMQEVARRPVIQLCNAMLAADPTLSVVGQRGLQRNFLGLGHLGVFSAVVLASEGRRPLGIYLSHHQTAVATQEVAKLARGSTPFLIASSLPHQVVTLVKWRSQAAPATQQYVSERLPAGVFA